MNELPSYFFDLRLHVIGLLLSVAATWLVYQRDWPWPGLRRPSAKAQSTFTLVDLREAAKDGLLFGIGVVTVAVMPTILTRAPITALRDLANSLEILPLWVAYLVLLGPLLTMFFIRDFSDRAVLSVSVVWCSVISIWGVGVGILEILGRYLSGARI